MDRLPAGAACWVSIEGWRLWVKAGADSDRNTTGKGTGRGSRLSTGSSLGTWDSLGWSIKDFPNDEHGMLRTRAGGICPV